MLELIVFAAASAALLYLSRGALARRNSHGFYRFFAWQCILVLVLINAPVWHARPFAPHQLLSWLLLALSIGLPIHAFRLLVRLGKPAQSRADPALFGFEKTTVLVTSGAFKYIRHPMYAALILLAWGVFAKQFSWPGLMLAFAATALLVLTALRDEQECLQHFGQAYRDYMGTSKRLIPLVF